MVTISNCLGPSWLIWINTGGLTGALKPEGSWTVPYFTWVATKIGFFLQVHSQNTAHHQLVFICKPVNVHDKGHFSRCIDLASASFMGAFHNSIYQTRTWWIHKKNLNSTSHMWHSPLGGVLGEGTRAGEKFSIFAPMQMGLTFRLTLVAVVYQNCAVQFNSGALVSPHICLSAAGHKSQGSATKRLCYVNNSTYRARTHSK